MSLYPPLVCCVSCGRAVQTERRESAIPKCFDCLPPGADVTIPESTAQEFVSIRKRTADEVITMLSLQVVETRARADEAARTIEDLRKRLDTAAYLLSEGWRNAGRAHDNLKAAQVANDALRQEITQLREQVRQWYSIAKGVPST